MDLDFDYPPELTEEQTERLVDETRDWQITHGIALKYRQDAFVRSVPIGVSLIPSPFPKRLFEQAMSLQKSYNELYMRVAGDPGWLYGILKE